MHINGFSGENQMLTACSAAPANLIHSNSTSVHASTCDSFGFTTWIYCFVSNTEFIYRIYAIYDHTGS